jgi:ATP-binding cassette subfamily C (CFTR/MRP) protein 4
VIVEVNLKEKIDSLPLGINTYCSEANNLFSAGQKQLICLARAIVRKAKILVLDEATANVDLETDNFIQRKLKERFSTCTVLIVAHRLATIIDSDRILVMSDGEAMEYNHPYCLMVKSVGDEHITRQHGYFSKMVLETDAETALSLFEMAKESYEKSHKKWQTVPKADEAVKADDVFFQEQDSAREARESKQASEGRE